MSFASVVAEVFVVACMIAAGIVRTDTKVINSDLVSRRNIFSGKRQGNMYERRFRQPNQLRLLELLYNGSPLQNRTCLLCQVAEKHRDKSVRPLAVLAGTKEVAPQAITVEISLRAPSTE